jgi:hypothetical protein
MAETTIRLLGASILSIVLLAAGLYVLLVDSCAGQGLEEAAIGWIGVVIGYWLKQP